MDARLLVVMQDECLLDLLRDNKFQVTVAASCQEAEKLGMTVAYAAVIIQTSVATREEMASVQRLLSASAPSPLIVVALSYHVPLLVQLWQDGVFAFLSLPLKYSRLKELLAAALTNRDSPPQQIVSAVPSWIEVNIPAHASYLVRLITVIECLLNDLAEQEQKRIIYAFRELVQNAMEHGSGFCSDKKINIRFLRNQDFLLFQVQDEGRGFDLQAMPHAVGTRRNTAIDVVRYRKQTGMRPGGLGISTILGIADDLLYNQKGNAVTMVKYLNKKSTL